MTREQELAFSILCSQNGWHKARIRESETEIRNLIHAMSAQIEALRGFAQDVMEGWPDQNEIPGDELQDIAEAHGLLRPETRTEACGENCACSEYGDFPATCYRKTELLTGQ